MQDRIRIGCAGWSLSSKTAGAFPGEGSHLERYAKIFNAVEISSSFYRHHQQKTYARWAEAVPENFRFSVKMPKEITHQLKLADCQNQLLRFLDEVSGLGGKLGVLLIQLSPKLALDKPVADAFFALLRQYYRGQIACEPRHPSWFASEAEVLLVQYEAARVAADPALPVAEAFVPGGWRGFAYHRLHGSPEIYYSSYSQNFLQGIATALHAATSDAWCIFDNTASGAAVSDALSLCNMIASA